MFLFNLFSIQNKDNLKYQINFDDFKFNDFLNDLYEISCIESYKFFSLKKEYYYTDDIILLRKNKINIVKKLKKKIFFMSNGENKILSYNDLYELFAINSNENVKKLYFFYN